MQPETASFASRPAILRLSQILPSPTNPRKRISDEMIANLAESISKVGVLQPILVRPYPGGTADEYEIVAGECRYRATSKAGLDSIPAVIRDLTDLQALELQVLENLHRSDLHPLEEAEGFQQLLDANGYTVPTLAHRLGKSKAYVYAALKLCALCDKAREMFFDGKLTASTALLVARIPGEKLQTEALKLITRVDYSGNTLSYREAARMIRQHYMLDISEAIFDPDDIDLVADAGDCASCPKRSGNARDLFPDIESADVCTDTTCFQTKRQAHIDRLLLDPKTITGEEAKNILPSKYSTYIGVPGYARPGARCEVPGHAGEDWKTLLGDDLPTLTVIVEGCDPVTVVDVAAARALVDERGLASDDAGDEEQPKSSFQLKQEAKAKASEAECARRTALLTGLHQQLRDPAQLERALTVAVPILLVDLLERLNREEQEHFSDGIPGYKGLDSVRQVDWFDELDATSQSRLLVELAAVATDDCVLDLRWHWDPEDHDDEEDAANFYAILRAVGIDPVETATDPTSAAHAEEKIAREENPEAGAETAAQAGEPDAQPEATPIEAANAAAKRAAKKPAAQTSAEAV